MSEIKKDTDDFLTLMSGLTNQKDKVNEMYLNGAKKSKAYQLIQQLNNYKFISPKAKKLASDLRKINLQKESLPEIQKEFSKLEQLHNSFEKLLRESKSKINSNQYELDLVSTDELNSLRKSKPSLFQKINLVAKGGSSSVEQAFRNYLKTHKEPEVAQEYERIRSPRLRSKDQVRGDLFRYGGAVIGAVLFIFILTQLMPVSLPIEIGFILLSLIFLILGFRRVNEYFRTYSQCLLIVYSTGFVLLTLLQGFGKLPETFQFLQLRELQLKVLSGLLGGLSGIFLGGILNFIPFDKTFNMPGFMEWMERRTRFFTISILLFGSIWTIAFKDNMNIYHFAEAKISQHLHEKQTGSAAETPGEILGEIQVQSQQVFVRTEPDLSNKENIVDVVTAGMVFDYYEVRKVGDTDWFRIIEPKSQQMVWISGSTVAKQ